MPQADCHYCESPALHRCPTCGRLYCEDHGEDTCLRCLSPESAMPGALAYRAALVAVVLGAAVTLYLIASPPEARRSAAAPGPGALPTATPARLSTPPATSGPASPTVAATPVRPSPTPAARTYTVQPGDVLSAIAARLGTTVDAILAVNPGLEADRLTPGQVITLPGAP